MKVIQTPLEYIMAILFSFFGCGDFASPETVQITTPPSENMQPQPEHIRLTIILQKDGAIQLSAPNADGHIQEMNVPPSDTIRLNRALDEIFNIEASNRLEVYIRNESESFSAFETVSDALRKKGIARFTLVSEKSR